MWQNHAGADMVGATVWDMHSLIKDYPVSEVGCVFDIRHAAAEAGEAWPVYYDLVKPHLSALSVKDFRWEGRKSAHTQLGKGNVDPKFFKTLRKSDFRGPISVHVEYLPKDGASKHRGTKARFRHVAQLVAELNNCLEFSLVETHATKAKLRNKLSCRSALQVQTAGS